MAKGEIVRFLASDGIELQGFFVDSKGDTAILHVHGINGNFYENSFLDKVADFASKKGMKFLSINTRGHDYVNDLVKIEGSRQKIVNIGGAVERFEDCVDDIKAGIEFLKREGCRKIILQGHSSGCQKIAYYKYKTKDRYVHGLMHLAPADDMTLVKRYLGKEYPEVMKNIAKMIRNGKTDDFMPKWTVTLPIISAGRLNSLCDTESIEARMFNYDGKLEELRSIDSNMLVIIAGNDKYLTMPAEKTADVIKSKINRCVVEVVQDAPHNFRGYEEELVKRIDKWMDDYVS